MRARRATTSTTSTTTTSAKRRAQWNRAALAYQARKRREFDDLRAENAHLAVEVRALADAQRDLERELEVLRAVVYGDEDADAGDADDAAADPDPDADWERRRRADEDYLAREATRAQLDTYLAFRRAVAETRPRLSFRDGTLVPPDAAREALEVSRFETLRLCSLPLVGTGPWSPNAAFSPPVLLVNEPHRWSSIRYLPCEDGRVFVRRDILVSRAGAPRLTAESALNFYTGYFTDYEFVLKNVRKGRVGDGPLAPWDSFEIEDPETRTTTRAIRHLGAGNRDSLFVSSRVAFEEMPLVGLDPTAEPGVVTCHGLVRAGEFRDLPTLVPKSDSESDSDTAAGLENAVAEPLGRRVARLGPLKHAVLVWDVPESESVRIVMVGQSRPDFRFWGDDRGELVRDGVFSERALSLMRSEEDLCFELHR